MDDLDPGSAVEAFRALARQFVPERMANDTGDGANDSHVDQEPPAPVSPSAILNSVEHDPVEGMEHAPVQLAESATSWPQDSNTVLFADPVGLQQGSISVPESNLASISNTTSTLGAINPATNMDLAFASAVLNNGLDSGLRSNSDALATISPSALLSGNDPGAIPDSSLPREASLLADVPAAVLSSHEDMVVDEKHVFGILPAEETAPNEYIVSILPASRSRSETQAILTTHRQEIRSFQAIFAADSSTTSPNAKTDEKIDTMLRTLTELSNLPPYHQDFPDLSQEEWMRYARDTVGKLAFIYEFLHKLRQVNVEIVIFADKPVINKLEAIVNQGLFVHRHGDEKQWVHATGVSSTCRVILMDTSKEAASSDDFTGNVVIAYDETAESSGLLRPYKTNHVDDQHPPIFTLIEVYSLEHINRRLSPTMDPLEKKLAQLKCLGELAQLIANDAMFDGIRQPHEVAEELISDLVDANGEFNIPPTRLETQTHQQIPDEVFDLYRLSREQSAPYGSRKRSRRGTSDNSIKPKRARHESEDDVTLSDELKARFGDHVRVSRGIAEVSLEELEDLVHLVSLRHDLLF